MPEPVLKITTVSPSLTAPSSISFRNAGRHTGGPFRSGKNPFGGSDLADGRDQFIVRDRDRSSARCADSVEDQKVADRLWHTQPGSDGRRIFEFIRKPFAFVECPDDRRTRR